MRTNSPACRQWNVNVPKAMFYTSVSSTSIYTDQHKEMKKKAIVLHRRTKSRSLSLNECKDEEGSRNDLIAQQTPFLQALNRSNSASIS
jgi:hypothetical protein